MVNARSAAVAVLLSVALVGCDAGTSTSDAPTASPPSSSGPTDLADVRDACVAEVAAQIKDSGFQSVTADEFFALSAAHDTLRVITPPPSSRVVNRAVALSAAQCAFRRAGAPADVVDKLSIPVHGEQRTPWIGFAGAWENDDPSVGFQASVVVHD